MGVVLLFPAVSTRDNEQDRAQRLQMTKDSPDTIGFSHLLCDHLCCVPQVCSEGVIGCSKMISEPKQEVNDPWLLTHCDPNKSNMKRGILKFYH